MRFIFRSRIAIVLLGTVSACLGVGIWWSPLRDDLQGHKVESESVPANPGDNELALAGDYVGSDACAQCHQEIAKSYMNHPMANSITLIDDTAEETRVATGQRRVVGEERVLFVDMSEGEMRHCEEMIDARGEEIYKFCVDMKYVVGSGRRAKAYISQRDDLLFMSPLNWYSQSKEWDCAPGYTPEDPRRFDRRITDECLSCHAGRVATLGEWPNRYQSPPFLEMAIGCENCHGPGAQHVAFHQSPLGSSVSKDRILNPARLTPDRRDAVCNQCHLQVAVRLPRSGKDHFDFRPGDRYEDVWTALDTEHGVAEDGTTRSVNHVQQMEDSRCFKMSDLGCISCHDPHRVPSLGERDEFYRNRCFSCHDNHSCAAPIEHRQRKENSCISCHMPTRDTNNMSHVTQTDHRIRRTAKVESKSGTAPENASLSIRYGKENLPEWEHNRALGVGAWIYLTKIDQRPPRSLVNYLIPVLDVAPSDGVVLLALSSMAQQHNLIGLARSYLEKAVSVPESEEEALLALADLTREAGEWSVSLGLIERSLEINPWNARTHALRADLLRTLGMIPEGIEAAERAVQLSPSLIPVRQWLVETYRKTGQFDKQRNHEEMIRRLQSAGQDDL